MPNLHRLAEARSLAIHRHLAERLDEPMVSAARARVVQWRTDGSVADGYVEPWLELLDQGLDAVKGAISADTEEMRALRQVSPFAGTVDARTRWRIWREVRSEQGV